MICNKLFLPNVSLNSLWHIISPFIYRILIGYTGRSKRKNIFSRSHVCLTLPLNGLLYNYPLPSLPFLGVVPFLFFLMQTYLQSYNFHINVATLSTDRNCDGKLSHGKYYFLHVDFWYWYCWRYFSNSAYVLLWSFWFLWDQSSSDVALWMPNKK